MISITVNGVKRNLEKNLKLSELVEDFILKGEKVAVELNLEVIRRKDWENVEIKKGDKIEIVHFVGGG